MAGASIGSRQHICKQRSKLTWGRECRWRRVIGCPPITGEKEVRRLEKWA
ncbi:hypothetical protein COLO4_19943 [Corchorus olitorius]|uniref:Uncharacterized protein n=1 Tax=Corchorus olitorius TaxID=93759 RepID=A0A1R3J2L1_9ROSI|nr:hypothetical protein COLO4_19943 [Corchorus olitorius]